MLIGVVGLGLIGGSFAKAYTKAGHQVYASDIDESVLQFAMMSDIVEGRLTTEMLKECDLILICTYAGAAINYLEDNGPYIGSKPIVIDCCGIKRVVVEKGMELAAKYGFVYAGGHPMAGTQYSGIKYSREDMYVGAPMVIVPPDYNDIILLDRIKKMLLPVGFESITVTSAEKHDEMIAYTSQLAHIVSNAYIKSPVVREHNGMSAGSYRDMTRVAWLCPEMWTELCMNNRDNLLKEIDILFENLQKYKIALENEDSQELNRLFLEGKRLKEEVDS